MPSPAAINAAKALHRENWNGMTYGHMIEVSAAAIDRHMGKVAAAAHFMSECMADQEKMEEAFAKAIDELDEQKRLNTAQAFLMGGAMKEAVELRKENVELREALEGVLASAVPHPSEHPAMHKAWQAAGAVLRFRERREAM